MVRFDKTKTAVALSAICCSLTASALDNGLARTPPMGWNSWNSFQLNINEKLIRSMTNAMVATGMKDAGYRYVIVDAGWKAIARDSNSNLVADPVKFPSGMKALADYVHGNGMKFGLYTDAGSEDCDGAGPGSKGFEEKDAATFALWGVDFMKEDWCKSEGLNAQQAYSKMSRAIAATGRPMLFSLCEWGDNKPWLWASSVANMWRTTGDNRDCWDCGRETMNKPGGYPRGWTLILDAQITLQSYSGPGNWNDPDMLEVGLPGLTAEESRAHFSLWALLGAPLITGADLRSMAAGISEIFLNKEVITVDQDSLGVQGTRVSKDGDLEVWMRPLSDGGRAVVLFNRSQRPAKIQLKWTDIGWNQGDLVAARDLWKHQETFVGRRGHEATVGAHAAIMLKVMRR